MTYSQEIINVGQAPNDGQGDPIRNAFIKTNNNFTNLFAHFVSNPPETTLGRPGDFPGMIAWSNQYFWYCYAEYDSVNPIWGQIDQSGAATEIRNGNTTIGIPVANGNAIVTVRGNANVAVFTSLGAVIKDLTVASGNVANINISNVTTSNIKFTSNVVALGNGAVSFVPSNSDLNIIGIGYRAAYYANSNVGSNVIAIGTYAGYDTSSIANSTIAIGANAGQAFRSDQTVAVGSHAGSYSQQYGAVAIGSYAGTGAQGANSVAIGANAAAVSQGSNSVAIGSLAGTNLQGNNAVAIGNNAAQTNQGTDAIAIGNTAASSGQAARSIAIGANSRTSGLNSIAIGANAATSPLAGGAIVLGNGFANTRSIVLSANTTQSVFASNVSLYVDPIRQDSSASNVTLNYNPTTKEVTWANVAGGNGFYQNITVTGTATIQNLVVNSRSIGLGFASAPNRVQASDTIAIGTYAAAGPSGNAQASGAIAIGYAAGSETQSANAVAIGNGAGRYVQSVSAVAVGSDAGGRGQGSYAVAIGTQAGSGDPVQGWSPMKTSGVAIGRLAGANNHGNFSVSIGAFAGIENAPDNSITLNATGGAFNAGTTGFYVKPVRSSNTLPGANTYSTYYDPFTGEFFGAPVGGGQGAYGNSNVASYLANSYTGRLGVATNIKIGYQAGGNNDSFRSGAISIGDRAAANAQGNNSIAIGLVSGLYNLGANTIAIGYGAGANTGTSAVVIGQDAGGNTGSLTVAIGRAAGGSFQGTQAVAVGPYAGYGQQGNNSVAVGYYSGYNLQGRVSVAVGYYAGQSSQGNNAVAIGYYAGGANQGNNSIAIGFQSGVASQGTESVAIGNSAASSNQGNLSVAIGRSAGDTLQRDRAVAIGANAAAFGQGNLAVAIGSRAANSAQNAGAVAIGADAGASTQGLYSVAVGSSAGSAFQGGYAVAVGQYAGSNTQGTESIAIGISAGNVSQGSRAVSIGRYAGNNAQGSEAVAIGRNAGSNTQGTFAVAVGSLSGSNTQGINSVAVGYFSGSVTQGNGAVAIGYQAGYQNQGQQSIAIGQNAGVSNQANNSIVLNASGAELNASQTGLYVNPVRSDAANVGQALYYNTATNEITFAPNGSNLVANIVAGNSISITSTGANGTGIVTINADLSAVNQDIVPASSAYAIGTPAQPWGNIISNNLYSDQYFWGNGDPFIPEAVVLGSQNITATGAASYVLDKAATTDSILVSVSGVEQPPYIAYGAGNTTLTFTSNSIPTPGAPISIRYFITGGGSASVYGNIQVAQFLANAGGPISGSTLSLLGNADVGGTLSVNVIDGVTSGVTIAAGGVDQGIALVPTGAGTVSVSDARISQMADPVDDNDAATKSYVDAHSSGLSIKEACNVATVAALPAYTYNNGTAGVGATITASANGALSVDGFTVQAGWRVLVKNETSTNAPYNGIYDVTQVGDAGTPFILTRSADCDTLAEFVGAYTLIVTGATNASSGWVCNATNVVVGTTPVTFVLFSQAGQYSAGPGLNLNGGQFSVIYDAQTIDIVGNQIKVADSAQLVSPNIDNATGISLNLTNQLVVPTINVQDVTISGSLNASNVTGAIAGNGSGLSNITGANVVGTVASASVAYSVDAGNIVGAALASDSLTATALAHTNQWTGYQNFSSLNNTGVGSQAGTLAAVGYNGNGAAMSFVRSGAGALNVGLDNDNVFRIGGGDFLVNLLQLNASTGALTLLSSITTQGAISTPAAVNAGSAAISGTLSAGATTVASISGDGSGLTNLSGAQVTGTVPASNSTNSLSGAAQAEAHNWSNSQNFQANGPTGSGSQAGSLVAYGAASATMSFHRPGAFGLNMGLDGDNVFRIGGWSASPNLLQLDMGGTLTTSASVTAYSDRRLKTNIKTIENALTKVSMLRGVSFDKDGKVGLGVIAQEVQEVLPELVHENADGYLSVAYANMVGVLIEAIKEQSQEIAAIKAELENVKNVSR